MSLDTLVNKISTLTDELVAHPASDVEYWFAKRLPTTFVCSACNGSGGESYSENKPCGNCSGTGEINEN